MKGLFPSYYRDHSSSQQRLVQGGLSTKYLLTFEIPEATYFRPYLKNKFYKRDIMQLFSADAKTF